MTLGEPRDLETLNTLAGLVRERVQPATPAQLARAWHDVAARLTARRAARPRLLRWSMVTGLAAAAALGLFFWHRAAVLPAPPMSFQVEGGSVLDGGYLLEGAGSSGIRLAFNEGTEFILTRGTRGRLRSIDEHGARIAIEQGSASFQVAPRRGAQWSVDVGPFLVTVKGTLFTVSWDAARERFEVRLRHGQVSVTGPVSGGEVTLRAGQRLVVNVPKAETVISELRPEDPWLEPVAPIAVPSAQESAKAAAPPPAKLADHQRPAVRVATVVPQPEPLSKPEASHGWAEALGSGHWDDILTEAERGGIRQILEKAPSDDLFALANAARYRLRADLARDALLAERRRFPGSNRALDAAYLLGRLEETSDVGAGQALHWYDEYLTRAPTGTYASEALGRKMIMTSRWQGAASARPIAEEYLRRFPHGTYAGSAQALQNSP